MLKQASINQIRSGALTRENGYIVISMCFYPRGLKKELKDEFRNDLAPTPELLKDFKHFQALEGHGAGFEKSHYEERFSLSRRAFEYFRWLAKSSVEKDVYLVCQCELGERCHREILLLIAQKEFEIATDPVFHTYPIYLKRLESALPTGQLRSQMPDPTLGTR